MSEQEVINCVKNHLQGRFNKSLHLNKADRLYCIKMIMDFLEMPKKKATEFFDKHILKNIAFDSTDIQGIKYVQGDGGAWVHLTAYNIKVHIDEENLTSFGEELVKLGKAYKVLGVGY